MNKKAIALTFISMLLVGLAQAAVPVKMARPADAEEQASAHGIGQRAASVVANFTDYLTTLHAPSDISSEGLERGTSLRFRSLDSGARYVSGGLGGGWNIVVEYFSGTISIERNVSMEFVNDHDEYANMSPVCGTDANVVRKMLKHAGYEEREEIGEIGNFLGWYYIRDDIVVSLVPQATEGPGDEPVLCVRSIRTTG